MDTRMRFECDFHNPATGEDKTIIVELDADEVKKVRAHACPEVLAFALALRRAYPLVRSKPGGDDFMHIRPPEGIRLLGDVPIVVH